VTAYSAFLLHQANGGSATEPAITLRCDKETSSCRSICNHFCGLSVTGNANNDGLSFPAPGCSWSEDSLADSDSAQCRGGCPIPLPKVTELYTSGEFDDAMEMVFGEETSVGYLCGVKEAIKDALTDPTRNVTIPGYCCLDTPTTSLPLWGKSVSVWLRRRFLVSELNSSRTHDCAISSFYFLDIHTSSHAQKTTARLSVTVRRTRPILLG
jgi:hypothetical protein